MVIVYGENFTTHHCFGRFGMVVSVILQKAFRHLAPRCRQAPDTTGAKRVRATEFRGKYMVVS